MLLQVAHEESHSRFVVLREEAKLFYLKIGLFLLLFCCFSNWWTHLVAFVSVDFSVELRVDFEVHVANGPIGRKVDPSRVIALLSRPTVFVCLFTVLRSVILRVFHE